MYRQSHSSFGKANFRVNSLPENYSGNAFRPQREEESEQKEPVRIQEISEREETARNLTEEKPVREKNQNTFSALFEGGKLNLSHDTALLFFILLVLIMGGGEHDDGAILTVLLLLII